MHTILGAGGVIAKELSKHVLLNNHRLRLVSRKPEKIGNAEIFKADLRDPKQVLEAVKGSSVVYLLAGLQYKLSVWQNDWPRIMQNTINACRRHHTKLIFFDNIYMYGKVDGKITEKTPYKPVSKKGEVRARIALHLEAEMKAGNLDATIARSPDFYGPGCKNSMFNTLVTDNLKKGRKMQWMGDPERIYTMAYTGDCGKALWLLADDSKSFNQIWHMPAQEPVFTAKQIMEIAAKIKGVEPKYSRLGKALLTIGGLFNPLVKELKEMYYQYENDYSFDSTKFKTAYAFKPTPYEDGIRSILNP